MDFTVPTTEQIAARMERAARITAPAVALMITCFTLLMQLAYDLGFLLGQALHERNDQLAALARRAVQQPAATPAAVVLAPSAPQAIPAAAPLQHPLLSIAADLEQLTVRQLQAITGCRRKCSKRQLIALALA